MARQTNWWRCEGIRNAITHGRSLRVAMRVHAPEDTDVVESGKSASDMYAQVKGTVVEVNKALEADPGLLNREPFGEGWIFVLKIDDPGDLKKLKDAAAYRQQIG